MITALLTAAGIGSRMGQDIPKQFLHVDNKPIIVYTLEVFQRDPNIDAIVVVTLESWVEVLRVYAKQFNITKLKTIVVGGETGQELLFRTQTPHVYRITDVVNAHRKATEKGISNTAATCVLMHELGEKVYFSKGAETNLKITTVEDLLIFKALLSTRKDEFLR